MILTLVLILAHPIEAFKETPAFSQVYINGIPIKATSYNDKIFINTQGHLVTTIQGDRVTIKIGNAFTCPTLQSVKGVDANGNFICGTL